MSQWHEAQLGRLQCRRDFVFAGEGNGVFYRRKQIRASFVEAPAEIIVVTVYVYYFSGERRCESHMTGMSTHCTFAFVTRRSRPNTWARGSPPTTTQMVDWPASRFWTRSGD